MKIEVHIKDKIIPIHCGEGKQKVRWIGDASVVLYEHFYSTCTNVLAIRLQDGTRLRLDDVIKDCLEDGANVWILFKEDLQALGIPIKQETKRPQTAKNKLGRSP